MGLSGKEFDYYYGVVYTNNNEDKVDTSYHLLSSENTDKQHIKISKSNVSYSSCSSILYSTNF